MSSALSTSVPLLRSPVMSRCALTATRNTTTSSGSAAGSAGWRSSTGLPAFAGNQRTHPTPLGSQPGSAFAAEFRLKRGALLGAQTTDPPRLRDAKPLHDLLCPHLANSRHGFQQRRDLHLAGRVFGLALVQHGRQGDLATLESVLDLSTILARLGRLLQGGCALFGSEGRKSHCVSPRVSDWTNRPGMG